MISGIRSALSGLLGFHKKMEGTAHNTANVATEGYKRVRVQLEEGATGTVVARSERIDTPGPLVEEQTSEGYETIELSNVDLARELPEALLSRRFHEANLKSIQTADEMLGNLLDIKE